MTNTTQVLAPSAARCRVCDAALPPGASTCAHCGAVYGEENRCPHCHVVAGVDVAAGIGRCRVCGGPRIAVLDSSIARSQREVPLLLQAQHAALGITVARFGGYAAFGGALFTTLFALLLGLLLHGAAVPITLGVLAVALGVVGAVLTVRSRRGRQERQQALDQALVLVAADVVSARPELDGAQVAQLLGTTAEQAELLLAEVNVNKLLASGMTEAARERIGLNPAEFDAQLQPPVDQTMEAPPLRATDISPPLAGPGRRS